MGKKNRKEAKDRASSYIRSVSDGDRFATKDGGIDPRQTVSYERDSPSSWGREEVKSKSAKKLNKYLDKHGYSLSGGEGQSVIGFRPIKTTVTSQEDSSGAGRDGYTPGKSSTWNSRQMVAIYGPSGGGSSSSSSGSSSSGHSSSGHSSSSHSPSGPSRPAPRPAPARPAGQPQAGGSRPVPGGSSPDLFPNPVQEGRAAENVAGFSNRLADYNSRMIGNLYTQATTAERNHLKFLGGLVSATPPAPDLPSQDDLYSIYDRFFGKSKDKG